MAYTMGGIPTEDQGFDAPPGEAFIKGALVTLYSDGLLYYSNAALADRYPVSGMAGEAATAAMVTAGTKIRVKRVSTYNKGASGLTPGATLFAGETDGTVTTTRPSTHLDIVQPVGMALSATEFLFNVGSNGYEQIGITS